MSQTKEIYSFHVNYPIKIADTFSGRFIGFMGKRKAEYGLLLTPCRSIHTFFMRMPIDVVFLDKILTVIHVERNVKPWRLVAAIPNARSVLELPAGIADRLGITIGKPI